MTRWLGFAALAAVLAVGLAMARADKDKEPDKKPDKEADSKKEADNKVAKAFDDLKAEFDKALKDAGKDAALRKAVLEKYTPKFLDHARNNPKDDSAVLALDAVLQMNSVKDKSKARQEAIDLLKKDYVKNKQIRPILRSLAIMGNGIGGDPVLLEIVKAVAKDNPDKLTRGTALDEMANSLEFQALIAESLARNEKRRAEYEERYGEEVVSKFIDSSDDVKKEADGLRSKVKSDYADVLAVKDEDAKGDEPEGKLKVGAKAPPESVCQDIDNKPVKLSDLEGKVVVLDFWATWCGPCRAMIPHTREMVKKNEKKPLVFISVSCDAMRETLQDFTSKNDMPWTHWWDGRGGKLASIYEVRAFPTIYVVDHKGVIQFKCVGYDEELDSVVERLVKEAEAAKKKN